MTPFEGASRISSDVISFAVSGCLEAELLRNQQYTTAPPRDIAIVTPKTIPTIAPLDNLLETDEGAKVLGGLLSGVTDEDIGVRVVEGISICILW